jgi:hypothetical protein
MRSTLPWERSGLSLTNAIRPRELNHSCVESSFAISDSRLPKREGPGPHVHIPKNCVALVLGFLFVASYVLQVYSGGIPNRLKAESGRSVKCHAKSDCTKQQPTNKRTVQSTRNRKKTQQNVTRGSH